MSESELENSGVETTATPEAAPVEPEVATPAAAESEADAACGGACVARRVVVGGLGTVVAAGYAAAFGYPLYRYLSSAADKAAEEASVKEVTLDADKVPTNSALMFKFGGRPAMLIHHADDTWTALNAVCTHLGCTVAYESASNSIRCACHGGVYDSKTGANVSGPPPKPLTALKTVVAAGKVVVSRV